MKATITLHNMYETHGSTKKEMSDNRIDLFEITTPRTQKLQGNNYPIYTNDDWDLIRNSNKPIYWVNDKGERTWYLTTNQYDFIANFLRELRWNKRYEPHMGISVNRLEWILQNEVYNDDDREGIQNTIPNIWKAIMREKEEVFGKVFVHKNYKKYAQR